ncbi:hypothetical protein [Salibaculum sp.]|uniref:hypothetical protein n=1 Tax=Salibaculum sp. TaxID=2855480 RepID=UPI002B496104|nr:hypothetical protein [Salibaculum sp.]
MTGVALKEGQINSGIIWITGLLVVSLIINWIADLFSAGTFGLSLSTKKENLYSDQLSDPPSRLKSITDQFFEDGKFNENPDIEKVKVDLKNLRDSMWWHSRYVIFYVVGWGLLIPVSVGVYAVCSVISV